MARVTNVRKGSRMMAKCLDDVVKSERAQSRTVAVKQIYIDMVSDLNAGIMLAQLIYWNSPDDHGKVRLRVQKKNRFCLAKADHEWWDEIRLTACQAKRARGILVNKGIVEVKRHRFGNATPYHFFLNETRIVDLFNDRLRNPVRNPHALKEAAKEKAKAENTGANTRCDSQSSQRRRSGFRERRGLEANKRSGSLTESTNTDYSPETTAKTIPWRSSRAEARPRRAVAVLSKEPFRMDQGKIRTLLSLDSEERVLEYADWWLKEYYNKQRCGDAFALVYRGLTDGWDIDEDPYCEWGREQAFEGMDA